MSSNYWKGARDPHSGFNNYNCYSPSGKIISNISPFNKHYNYQYGYLKHYRTKTIEEYINKVKRGRADTEVNYKDMAEKFFLTNKKTKEKLNIFKTEFNISFH